MLVCRRIFARRRVFYEAAVADFILRMEGVDFAPTVLDTHNLSAFRGGSLAEV